VRELVLLVWRGADPQNSAALYLGEIYLIPCNKKPGFYPK